MTPDQIVLAQRLAQHPAFWWQPGMDRLRWSDTVQEWRYAPRSTAIERADLDKTIPVLTDPATRGCLLDLARTAWNCPSLHAYLEPPYRNGFPDGPGWRVNIYDAKGALALFRASTEGEVLALAILESP